VSPRLTPWHDTEEQLARSMARVREQGRVVMESEAWALALTLLRRVFPDVTEREIHCVHLGTIDEPGWLESEAWRIARARARAIGMALRAEAAGE
jgi:hypothetical protein